MAVWQGAIYTTIGQPRLYYQRDVYLYRDPIIPGAKNENGRRQGSPNF